MSTPELIGKNCLLYKNLDLLGKKWMVFLILEMGKDVTASYRYRDFEKILPGVTSRAISMRLEEMVLSGIVVKTKLEIKGAMISYKLSKSGIELISIIKDLQQWSNKFGKCKPKSKCDRCDLFEDKIKYKKL